MLPPTGQWSRARSGSLDLSYLATVDLIREVAWMIKWCGDDATEELVGAARAVPVAPHLAPGESIVSPLPPLRRFLCSSIFKHARFDHIISGLSFVHPESLAVGFSPSQEGMKDIGVEPLSEGSISATQIERRPRLVEKIFPQLPLERNELGAPKC